ncbi:putative alpha/beta-fold hydrolase [Xanthomonas arboricola]|nr:putative alpha/beta-fold hydrolase [Xanthomonas sp. 3058]
MTRNDTIMLELAPRGGFVGYLRQASEPGR